MGEKKKNRRHPRVLRHFLRKLECAGMERGSGLGLDWLDAGWSACISANHEKEPHGADQSRGVSHSRIQPADWCTASEPPCWYAGCTSAVLFSGCTARVEAKYHPGQAPPRLNLCELTNSGSRGVFAACYVHALRLRSVPGIRRYP